ncbi:MAG: hypothetical protein WBD11_04495, partial [Xanthobacteraceae bacterium]
MLGQELVGRQLGGRLCWLWSRAIAARIAATASLAAMTLFLLPASAPAQVHNLVAPQSVTAPAAGPATGSPGATIVAPMPAAPPGTSPVAQAAPAVPA